jgi:Ni,Fe-hydrogenase III large subunit
MLQALLEQLPAVASHRTWPRVQVSEATWCAIGTALRAGELELLGEWGDAGQVHCAVRESAGDMLCIATVDAIDGALPSLAQMHAPALRLERAASDLYGLRFVGLPDTRPWLDHGHWPLEHPLASELRPAALDAHGDAPRRQGETYAFLPADGPSLHQIPVGPVHAGIIEPGHFRFTASGETVVRLEERLGYVHRGIERQLIGRTIQTAAPLAARVSGDSTVAYSFAFALAVEQALQLQPPPRAQWLRGVMGELERIANHLGDIGAICNDAAFALLQAECSILREHTLRACAEAFGHRLMMDRIVPGGVAIDLGAAGVAAILGLTARLERDFPELVELYENTASLQDRTVGTGVLTGALAAQFAAGGYVGRASGRAFDARSAMPYAPYDELKIGIATRSEGDVDARVWIRIFEVQESVRWLQAALAALPAGSTRADLPMPGSGVVRESTALVEGFRGDILVYVRLSDTLTLERCHLRDPSWFQWPLLEAAIAGNIVADFPLCNKSFNCSYAGHDL